MASRADDICASCGDGAEERAAIAVYGASGHTGRFVVAELRRRNLPVIAIGRSAARLDRVNASEARVAALDDPVALDQALAGATVVINCAGPFLDTAQPLIEAALRRGANYLDVTAEQQAARDAFANYDEAARRAGVKIVPAASFFGGLADLLVRAAMQGWHKADDVRIGVVLDSWQPTRGTRIALHVSGKPLILFNVWDAGSARAVASAGAHALATGSWSVAAAHGLADGEKLALDLAIANLERIVAVTGLPVSIDIESGYGDPARTIARTIEAGAVGCNIEDSFPQDGMLREISERVARIREARRAAEAAGVPYFINARTDVFFQKGAEESETFIQAAIERAHAYADAGADGIFVPGLTNIERIAELAAASPLPVNVMLDQNSPGPDAFAQAGASRVSYGPAPYLLAMKALEDKAALALKEGAPDR